MLLKTWICVGLFALALPTKAQNTIYVSDSVVRNMVLQIAQPMSPSWDIKIDTNLLTGANPSFFKLSVDTNREASIPQPLEKKQPNHFNKHAWLNPVEGLLLIDTLAKTLASYKLLSFSKKEQFLLQILQHYEINYQLFQQIPLKKRCFVSHSQSIKSWLEAYDFMVVHPDSLPHLIPIALDSFLTTDTSYLELLQYNQSQLQKIIFQANPQSKIQSHLFYYALGGLFLGILFYAVYHKRRNI